MSAIPICLALFLLGILGPSTEAVGAKAGKPTPAAQAAADSMAKVKPLPSKRLEQVYRNGDLDSVVLFIKMGRPRPMFLDRTDSILAFKYLGIIYSAEAQSREKGRYYFNQLLLKDPKASITELLPGENARMTFKEVREEYFELHPEHALNADAPPAGPASPEAPDTLRAALVAPVGSADSGSATVTDRKRSWTWLWWTGGVVAAGGAAAVVLLDPPAKTYSLHD